MKAKTLLAAALTATLGYGTNANASIIDLFDDPAGIGVNIAEDTSLTAGVLAFDEYPGGAVGSPTIIGGYRDIIADIILSNGIGTPKATIEVGGGGLSFSTSAGDTGIGKVQWDGKDSSSNLDPIGLRDGGTSGLDLINQVGCPLSGCDRFVAQVLEADLGFEYQIGVYTDSSNYTILSANTQFAVAAPGVIADYLFSWFSLPTANNYFFNGLFFDINRVGEGPTFTDIGALEFVVNSDGGTVAVDLTLDSITKTGIPEPGMLALMGIGLLAGGLAGRRRQAHKV